jgi:hypothetical protein
MTEIIKNLASDEKNIPTMFYTSQKLIWGQLIAKELIRVCTWLQTPMAPNYLDIAEAQVLLFGAGQNIKNLRYPLLHVGKQQILAYHILPPADESPYFDENEPNRSMEAVTIMTGIFRFDGFLRMAQQSDLKTYLSVQKGDFIPVHKLSVSCPLLPSLKEIHVPFALINQNAAVFSFRE